MNNISLSEISHDELSSWYCSFKEKDSLNDKEAVLLELVLNKLKDTRKMTNELIPLFKDGDIIDLALDFKIPEALQSFVSVSGRIDVPSSNHCDTRRGSMAIRLPVGYSYYDHRYDEFNANPKPGDITITPLQTGVNVSWTVPFVGTFIGPWCGGEHSWLLAEVTVRGVNDNPNVAEATVTEAATCYYDGKAYSQGAKITVDGKTLTCQSDGTWF
jgi:hypothetical protein